MRRFKFLALLALLAGTTTGCATATRRGDGLASIRSRPRPEMEAPPQHLVTTTGPDSAPTDHHAGIFARPEGLSKFFPALQKDVQKDVAVAPNTAARTSWLGRRLRGMGQGSPTSLTYSTAPKPGGDRKSGPGEVSILPVALTIPRDHPRDREVTTTRAEADPGPEDRTPTTASPATDALTPLEPANPESFSTAAREVPSEPTQEPTDQPKPEAPTPTPPPATSPEPAPVAPMPEPTLPEPTLPEPTLPEPKVESPPVAQEPSTPGPEQPSPTPTPKPDPEPALAAPEPAPTGVAKPSAPDRPTVDSPASPAPETGVPTPDPRERPRLPSARPRPVTNVVPPAAGPRKDAPAPVATSARAATSPAIPSKSIPVAALGKAAEQGERTASVVAANARLQDRYLRAAKVQAEAARSLGLPDPTLPASYYRSDAVPVQGDAAVVATMKKATSAPVDPAVAQVNGPCPHCGHDPHWRPSLQRFGRRVFGLGEFATPQP